jgi:hypothetical protein
MDGLERPRVDEHGGASLEPALALQGKGDQVPEAALGK